MVTCESQAYFSHTVAQFVTQCPVRGNVKLVCRYNSYTPIVGEVRTVALSSTFDVVALLLLYVSRPFVLARKNHSCELLKVPSNYS